MADVLVIIPVLNEAETIAGVINSLQQQGLSQICVVDNGSCDRTADIATNAGAIVISEPRKGYGQACWSGLQTPEAVQAEWILFCDGDGSDDLSQLPDLLALRAEYALVLGNRRGTQQGRSQLTPVQNFGNWLATWLLKLGWGVRYDDLGPLRLIRKSALDQLEMRDRGFGWTIEMQAKAAEAGFNICELPVNYRPRQGGKSKISGTVMGSVKAGRVILTTLAQLYWQKSLQQRGQKRGQKRVQKFIQSMQSVWAQRLLRSLSVVLLVAGSLWAVPQGDFLHDPQAVPQFWLAMGLMSVGYGLSWGLQTAPSRWFWAGAIAPRLILLAMHPGDDIWRYLWEGYLQTQGLNPYLIAPDDPEAMAFRFDWWSQINHPDHAGIYPPVAQLGFRLLASISSSVSPSVSPSVLLFKLSFVAADLSICWLLSRRFGHAATLLYAWNPLVIYSFAGGGHYDSWFLLLLVAAWLTSEQALLTPLNAENNSGHWRWSAVGSALLLGLSIATKWMSLPVLGFLAWRSRCWRWHWAIGLGFIGLLPLTLALLPFSQDRLFAALPLTTDFVTYGRSAALIGPFIDSLWPTATQPDWLKTNGIYAVPLVAILLWNALRLDRTHQRDSPSSPIEPIEPIEPFSPLEPIEPFSPLEPSEPSNSLDIGPFTERYLIALLLLSPIIHAWYFTWLVPFAVASRNWGIRLVSLSAFVYFALPHNLATGTAGWVLSPVQQGALWGPFIVGLGISTVGPKRQP